MNIFWPNHCAELMKTCWRLKTTSSSRARNLFLQARSRQSHHHSSHHHRQQRQSVACDCYMSCKTLIVYWSPTNKHQHSIKSCISKCYWLSKSKFFTTMCGHADRKSFIFFNLKCKINKSNFRLIDFGDVVENKAEIYEALYHVSIWRLQDSKYFKINNDILYNIIAKKDLICQRSMPLSAVALWHQKCSLVDQRRFSREANNIQLSI